MSCLLEQFYKCLERNGLPKPVINRSVLVGKKFTGIFEGYYSGKDALVIVAEDVACIIVAKLDRYDCIEEYETVIPEDIADCACYIRILAYNMDFDDALLMTEIDNIPADADWHARRISELELALNKYNSLHLNSEQRSTLEAELAEHREAVSFLYA